MFFSLEVWAVAPSSGEQGEDLLPKEEFVGPAEAARPDNVLQKQAGAFF